ncbi:MAG: DUF2997 domain-containing protein [Verrucomicrobiaceae bacterium]|nr:MAG: DUF2997 domain-containing protein [Verrucomicrobiaceae bacterium]
MGRACRQGSRNRLRPTPPILRRPQNDARGSNARLAQHPPSRSRWLDPAHLGRRLAVSRRIHVRVSPAGDLTVEAEGFKGKGCEAATKAIEEALGKPRTRTRKPEFWRHFTRHQNQQQLGEGGA